MYTHKHIVLGFLILLLLAAAILNSCWKSNMHTKKMSYSFSELIDNFSELIKSENINDLKLTIYCMNPFILTLIPVSVDSLINTCNNYSDSDDDDDTHKIIINGDRLEEHIDLLNQLNTVVLIPVEQTSYINTRLYYVFETDKDGKIFDVATGGVQINDKGEFIDGCLYVNGLAFEENDIFYDIIMSFLPEDYAKDFEMFLYGKNQDEDAGSNE